MKQFTTLAAALAATFLSCAPAGATTVTLTAIKDAGMYSQSATAANGAGEYIHVGTNSGGDKRRSLIKFDLSSIPSGSTITGVTMTLHMDNVQAGAQPENISAFRVTQDWSEGPTIPSSSGGHGATAVSGDVTWQWRTYSSTQWTNLGGTYIAGASATTNVPAIVGDYNWTGAGLVADAQAWVDGTASNYGWILIGNEVTHSSSKRISSRQNTTISERPKLTIVYTPPATTGRCCFSDGTCQVITSAQCSIQGGTYGGNGTNCNPNVCFQPTGACCFGNGTCQNLSPINCAAQNGYYQGNNTNCGSTNCPVLSGACCLPNAQCIVTTQALCASQSGIYHGDNTTCTGVTCYWSLTPFVDPLPIPPVASPTTGTAGDAAHYDINIIEVQHQFHRDLPVGIVWAYEGYYPGPTIEARKYKTVTVNWHNDLRTGRFQQLRTTHYLPVDTCLHGPDVPGHGVIPFTVTHLHGAHLRPDSDGDPDSAFPPGQTSPLYTYPNVQEAATLWYHDHATGLTRLNVYMGLAGFYLLRDDNEDALNLPRGQFEIPLVIQDRSFDANGLLRYTPQFQDHFFGEFICVNGKVWPYLDVARTMYRFRIVNGSSNRTYTLSMPRSMFTGAWQIGTDLGLLPHPVAIGSLTIMPGERADILIDFSNFTPGTQITMTNSAVSPFPSGGDGPDVVNVMRFVVNNVPSSLPIFPVTLNAVPPIPASQATNTRTFRLAKTFENHCNHDIWLINSLGWDDLTDFPLLGSTEIWSFVNQSGISHPMHIHLVAFQVLDRQNFTVGSGGQIIPSGSPILPSAWEKGWKDTVQATPNQITRVIAKFDDFPGKFPFHCHILDHEDHEMMRQFQAVCRPIIITQNPFDRYVLPGDVVELNMAAQGDLLSYQWERPDSPLPLVDGPSREGNYDILGVSTPLLRISGISPLAAGIYRARAIDPCGFSSVTSASRLIYHTCVADVDDGSGAGVPDGGVTIDDLLFYLHIFTAGSILADTDDGEGHGQHDGGVTIDDLLFYLARFVSGC